MSEKIHVVIDSENFETSPEELDEVLGSPDVDYEQDKAYSVDEVEILLPKEAKE